MKHIFTGNSLDRGDVERRDEDWINSNSKSEDARYLTMSDLNPLVRLGSNSSAISWKSYADVTQFAEDGSDLIFLGVKNNKPHFVMDLLADKEKLDIPINEAVYRVLYRKKNIDSAIQELLNRPITKE